MTSKERLIKVLRYYGNYGIFKKQENIHEDIKELFLALDVMEIFKKYFFIKISETSTCDNFYYILLKDKNTYDYMGIYVNKEEKDLLKEYFKDEIFSK